MKKKIAIIGYGSLIRNDDAVGLIITEKLENEFKNNKLVDCYYSASSMDILGYIEEYEIIYIIDCAMIDLNYGEFIKKEINEIKFNSDNYSSHNIAFNEIKNKIKKMNKKTKIFFYLIKPKNMDFGEKLSNEIQKNMGKIYDTIHKELQNYLNTNSFNT
ncbi:MAG: hydrogenase maturation protease [Nanoarchaeota archaeon]